MRAAVFAVGLVALVGCGRQKELPPEESAPPPRQPAALRPATRPLYFLGVQFGEDDRKFAPYRAETTFINNMQFSEEFQGNELRAIQTYRGQRFYVAGVVTELAVSGEKGEVTKLTLGYAGFTAVYCECPSQDRQLLKIRAGSRYEGKKWYVPSTVLLDGVCENSITFKNCRVVEVIDGGIIEEKRAEPPPPPTLPKGKPAGIVGVR